MAGAGLSQTALVLTNRCSSRFRPTVVLSDAAFAPGTSFDVQSLDLAEDRGRWSEEPKAGSGVNIGILVSHPVALSCRRLGGLGR